ncbi:MAG: hypothetical protein ACP5P4_15140 [Steroidobacteraceae bacterium]
MPDTEQWKLLRERASDCAAYKNKHIQACLADALKWGVPQSADKPTLVRHVRATERGMLSAAAYTACETEVRKDWTRDGRKIMAGAPLPQYRQKDSLAVATKGKNDPCVRLIETPEGKFIAAIHVHAQEYEGGGWMHIPVHPKTDRDAFRWPLLQEMALGRVPIACARVVFRLMSGKTLLQLTYSKEIAIPEPGERVATLGVVGSEVSRLLVRSERDQLDITDAVSEYLKRKDNFDLVRRRACTQIGRKKGGARAKRRLFAKLSIRDWTNTHFHQLSARVIRWCAAQGVGELRILDLGGGDWPAAQFAQYLKCRGENDGIGVTVVTPESSEKPSTERALKRETDRKRRKSKKLGDALREIKHQTTEVTA